MIAGVPGVGKTSLANHVLIPHDQVQTATFGQYMYRAGRSLGHVSSYEDLERITLDIRARLQAEAVRLIGEDSTALPIVIEGHLVVDSPSGFVPGLPAACVDELHLAAIVVLYAQPDEVVRRRQAQADKYRPLSNDPERITRHDELTQAAAAHYSLQRGISLEFLRNPQNELDATAKTFVSYLKCLPGALS